MVISRTIVLTFLIASFCQAKLRSRSNSVGLSESLVDNGGGSMPSVGTIGLPFKAPLGLRRSLIFYEDEQEGTPVDETRSSTGSSGDKKKKSTATGGR
jgi:hypothetical protein